MHSPFLFLFFFFPLPLHPPSRRLSNLFSFFFSYDPVKDDSAENGMPLAFLISAFCRLLSTNGTRPRYRRADSAARSTLRGIFARKIYISGRRTVPRRFLDFCGCPLFLFLSRSTRIIRCRNVTVRTWLRETRRWNWSHVPVPTCYPILRSNLSYFHADNKITIDLMCIDVIIWSITSSF